jgi:protein-tyrosine-phosphatase
MAESFFQLAASGRHEARSAGTTPAEHVHPEVVEVMREVGVDLANRVPHKLEQADAEWADVVSPWGAEMRVLTFRASATSTGSYKIRPASRLTLFGASAMRFSGGFRS